MTLQKKMVEQQWYMCDQCGYPISTKSRDGKNLVIEDVAHVLQMHGKTYHFHNNRHPHTTDLTKTWPWDHVHDCLGRWILANGHLNAHPLPRDNRYSYAVTKVKEDDVNAG